MPRLEQIREDLAFEAADVARAAGWSVTYLRERESTDNLDADDADVLSRLYGVDVTAAIETPAAEVAHQPLRALLRGATGDLTADDRFAIAEVATIAREHRGLLSALGRRDRWPVVASFSDDTDYGHPADGAPERLAALARAQLGLSDQPIASITELLRRELGVLLVWVDVSPDIDAFAMATPDTGAVIALNVSGPHTRSPFSRRVTLAHELCHLLFDRHHMRSMGRFCAIAVRRRTRKRAGDDLPIEEKIERRARSFAAAFLVPRAPGIQSWARHRDPSPSRRVRAWMTHWGIGYEAARAHLDTLGRLPMGTRLHAVETEAPPAWAQCEPEAPSTGPTAAIPLARRGDFFATVLEAVREQAIGPARARDLLQLDRAGWALLVNGLDAPPLRERSSPEVSSSVLADWL